MKKFVSFVLLVIALFSIGLLVIVFTSSDTSASLGGDGTRDYANDPDCFHPGNDCPV